MTVVNDGKGGVFAHGVGWCDVRGGGKAVTVTVILRRRELGWLKKFIKMRDKRDTITQDDADGLILACLGAGLDCWALTHGYTKREQGGLEMLRAMAGDK